ncbi:uncharacterized protein MAM_05917 [Metarhizium album ARSEF 1941]|uniref:Uncharacterized protein n=1 Tax=Metarhizium album (strain ARSEF 1941) TaxID=1081103 RepID=A0A0B2WJW7_METAS|nr:uncharacterized protein MAM_05917 [Metarhizium album ARSEF 1941]KHN96331.1 hypothetical protein MAM_05917 [Metarhizium album ARSEF 1941]
MGFLDPFTDGLSIGPGGMSRPSKHRRDASRSRRKHRSRSRSSSRARGGANSITGALLGGLTGDSHYSRHNSSRGSFFGTANNSRSSFFNFGNRSSYYKRSPRQGFMQRAYRRLRRLIRDLIHYAKRHPWKVFFLVVMPLVTTGALAGLLARFGLRIPPSLERMMGVASRAASGDSLGLVSDAVRMAGDLGRNTRGASISRGRDGALQWERRSSYGSYGGYDDYGYGNSRARGGSGDTWSNTIADVARRFL